MCEQYLLKITINNVIKLANRYIMIIYQWERERYRYSHESMFLFYVKKEFVANMLWLILKWNVDILCFWCSKKKGENCIPFLLGYLFSVFLVDWLEYNVSICMFVCKSMCLNMLYVNYFEQCGILFLLLLILFYFIGLSMCIYYMWKKDK